MGVIFIPTKKTYENLEKMIFSGVGEYGIPKIMPEKYDKLLKTAKGHSDNESVQAARRTLAKRGIDWKTGKKLKR